MRSKQYYVDVSTLLDRSWSGIANVTANICKELLAADVDVQFFSHDILLKKTYVQNALEKQDGSSLEILLRYGFVKEKFLEADDGRKDGVAIFPNFFRAGQEFGRRILIVHDLSFVITPEFHPPNRVLEYKKRIYSNAHQSDLVVCVSEATKRDLQRYYHVAEDKIIVSHLGVCEATSVFAPYSEREFQRKIGILDRKYFLILGTVEPRKNISVVLEYIVNNIDVLDEYSFVFAGRDGWGETFEELVAKFRLRDPRVVHIGYVNEMERVSLLAGAFCLIFPSWFEGFGMPVIEAMAMGTPVIGSDSSSIIEAGGDAMIRFSPFSIESLKGAIKSIRSLQNDEYLSLRKKCTEWAAKFQWSKFVNRILERV